jgi:hypothetical protein
LIAEPEPEAKEAELGGAAASRLADAVEARQIAERVTDQGVPMPVYGR